MWKKIKKFVQDNAKFITMILALLGYGTYDQMQESPSEGVKQSADVPTEEDGTIDVITFELTFYAKQRGTPDNIRLEETFQAEKLPPLEDVIKAATIPEGYAVSESLPVFIKEVRREKRVIPKPPTKKPLPPTKKEAETQ